jgi:DNA/RNA endonuclease YhcR with UshA esterase domain
MPLVCAIVLIEFPVMTRRTMSIAGFTLIAVMTAIALIAYRMGMRGALSDSRPPVPGGGACVDIQQAAAHANEEACVTGRVLRAYTSKSGNTFLDFCQDYRSCPFTSIIFASDRSKFGNLVSLQGRQIELRGKIQIYRDQPEIVLRDASQIREAP